MAKQYYGQLDTIRGYAVMSVIFTHTVFVPFIMKFKIGVVGLNLFFVMSGFLITEILYNDVAKNYSVKQILKKFYWRRTLRIFPLYYLVCIAAFLLNFDTGRKLFVYNATYVTNIYLYLTNDVAGAFVHIWLLCVEEQFYLIWPALLLMTLKVKLRTILTVIGIAVLIRFCFWYFQIYNFGTFNYSMTPACFDAFGFGGLLAYFKSFKVEQLKKILKLWLVPTLCILFYIYITLHPENIFLTAVIRRLVLSIFSFYIIGFVAMDMYPKNKILNVKAVKYIGTISYGVYLFHVPVIHAMNDVVSSFLQNISFIHNSALKYNLYVFTFPFFTVVIILIATLSYNIIEMPFLKLKTKFK